MASTLTTPVAQAISLLFDGNLGRLLNYGLRPGYGLLGVWSPLTLFTNGEQGVWYDPSDFSTMFQDSAGTTPVTAVEQPVGRILDKSGNGKHATQATSTKRPVLSALVNLLTKTEDFSAAVWTKLQATITANTTETADPLGGNTADKLVERVGPITSALVCLNSAVNATNATQYTTTVYAKAAGRRYCAVFANGIPLSVGAYFDLQDGVATTIGANNLARSIISVGNGWWKLSITFLTTSAFVSFSFNLSDNGTSNSYTGDGTKGIYIWGASIVPADQASLPYQWVDTATSYDISAVFPKYLKFDGLDDSLSTGSIDFSATDKMTVFAGVRKLGNNILSVLLGLSPSYANIGSFELFAPYNADSYDFRSTGTAVSYASTTSYPSPVTNVATGIFEISNDVLKIRINGIQAASSVANQGTGNFGNYPIYIGSRGGTQLPFNGHLYSLIVRGAQSSEAQILSAETYCNQKTGAY